LPERSDYFRNGAKRGRQVKRKSLIAAAICLSLPQVAYAADVEPTPQATKKEDDPSKFFWFYKPETNVAVAKTDIQYCFIQTSTIRAAQKPSSGAGGLIGALVEGIIKGIAENVESRRMRDSGMRKCMGLYAYERYAVPEVEWNAMMRATDAIDRLAAFSSGPRPTYGRLNP
jgi:hypothetical protein